MADITIVTGVYKPTNITGGPHIVGFNLNQGSGLILVAKSHQASTGTISTGMSSEKVGKKHGKTMNNPKSNGWEKHVPREIWGYIMVTHGNNHHFGTVNPAVLIFFRWLFHGFLRLKISISVRTVWKSSGVTTELSGIVWILNIHNSS